MTLASTWFDPVLGVDIHITMIPTPGGPVPTPMPFPFVGMVFDPKGAAIGAALSCALGGSPTLQLINGLPATNCGTEVVAVIRHIPAPGVAFMIPPDNNAQLYFGSYNASIGGSYFVRLGDIALSCADPVRMPTSVVLAVPKGAPVLVGPPMVPDVKAIAMALAMKAVFKGLGAGARRLRRMQRASRRWRAASAAVRRRVNRVVPRRFRSRVHRAVCHVTGHPVDVANGRMFTDAVDIELPGPLPLRFERTYDTSLCWKKSSLGYGWAHSLDASLWIERGKIVISTDGAQELSVPTVDLGGRELREGASVYDSTLQLTVRRTGSRRYEVQDAQGVVQTFAPVAGGAPGVSYRIEKRDRLGHTIEFHYDDHGRLESVRDSAQRLLRLEYDKNGMLSALKVPVTSGHGHRVHRRFFYNDAGDLVRIEDSLGQSWRFEYVGHLMVQETDRSGLSFYFQYDRHGSSAKCVRTWGDGGIYDHEIHYAPDGLKTVVEDSVGATTVYEMNDLGQVVSVTDPHGGKTAYAYDDNTGQRTLEQDALGRKTELAYDEQGNLLSVVAADGSKVRWEYDERFNLPQRFWDALNQQWSFTYDRRGRLIQRKSPDGQALHYDWDEDLLKSLRDEHGRRVSLGYDDTKALVEVRDPAGATEHYTHDGLGRLVKTKDPQGSVHRLEYDTEGRAVKVTRPMGGTQSRRFDVEGNLVELRDGRRHLRLGYGGFHQVAWREEAGARVQFKYDTEERLVAVVNQAGERYQLARDPVGNISAEIGFDERKRTYLRDAVGQLTQTVAELGASTNYTYDDLGRVTEIACGQSVTKMVYREDGALLRTENEETWVEFERDGMGRVIAERTPDTWVQSEYDPAGGRSVLKSSLGAHQEIKRGLRGEVMGLVQRDARKSHEVSFERDVLGREKSRVVSGGVELHWKRDAMGRPLERVLQRVGADVAGSGGDARAQTIDQLHYQWREGFQLASILDAHGHGQVYEHDDRGRLVAERNTRGIAGAPDAQTEADVIHRAMDAVGNVYRSAAKNDRQYSKGGRLEHASGIQYKYGDNGERIEKQTADGKVWRYAYNGAGRLCQVDDPDGHVVRFKYDPLGRRVEKSKTATDAADDAAPNVTRYIWDGHVVLHEVRNATHSLAEASASLDPAQLTTWYWEPGTWNPVAKVQGDQALNIHTDHLGTPREMTDEVGALAWKLQLDAFGVPQVNTEANASGGKMDCPWRFSGQYEDEETGLYYNNQRYYDPEAGQYIKQDPIGLLGGMALYGYVEDSAGWVDPWGLAGCKGTVLGEYDAMSPGPLADDVAEAFSGGRYRAIELTEATVFYRGGRAGGGRNSLGQWFNNEPPASRAHVHIDNAVKRHWINNQGVRTGQSPVESVYAVEVPAGTVVYEGPTSYQGGVYLGGSTQVYVAEPWKISGVRVLSEKPLP